ncbi:MAG: pilus assembly protein, partial [Anaerolineae bacterium]|nr:pilus assembly protein [Anaerolineae bacterium]
DLGYNMYSNTMLIGSIQQAARNSSIEGADTAEQDAIVTKAVHGVVPNAQLEFSRKSYTNFSDVNVAVEFDDLNGDGTCNDGEAFQDANLNGTWDQDRGVEGSGNARDAVLYKVTVHYPRAFPMAGFIGLDDNYTVSTVTVLRNQPYNLAKSDHVLGNCP